MCLALPMRITALDGSRATIAVEGLEQECSVMLVPDAGVGDYVLVHAGFAISVIDEAEAQETYELLREIAAFDEGEHDAATTAPWSAVGGADRARGRRSRGRR